MIREGGAKAGIALNPATPIEHLSDILPAADFVLLMSVNPGFGGQVFLPYVLDKARRLCIQPSRCVGWTYYLEVDGGIGPANIRSVVEAGVRTLVAGSAVFGSDDPSRRTTGASKTRGGQRLKTNLIRRLHGNWLYATVLSGSGDLLQVAHSRMIRFSGSRPPSR